MLRPAAHILALQIYHTAPIMQIMPRVWWLWMHSVKPHLTLPRKSFQNWIKASSYLDQPTDQLTSYRVLRTLLCQKILQTQTKRPKYLKPEASLNVSTFIQSIFAFPKVHKPLRAVDALSWIWSLLSCTGFVCVCSLWLIEYNFVHLQIRSNAECIVGQYFIPGSTPLTLAHNQTLFHTAHCSLWKHNAVWKCTTHIVNLIHFKLLDSLFFLYCLHDLFCTNYNAIHTTL